MIQGPWYVTLAAAQQYLRIQGRDAENGVEVDRATAEISQMATHARRVRQDKSGLELWRIRAGDRLDGRGYRFLVAPHPRPGKLPALVAVLSEGTSTSSPARAAGLLLAIALAGAAPAQAAAPDPVDLGRRDHQLHAGVSTGLTLLFAELVRPAFPARDQATAPLVGALMAFTLGAVKEAIDPIPSRGDLGADAIGCAAGVVLSWTVHL